MGNLTARMTFTRMSVVLALAFPLTAVAQSPTSTTLSGSRPAGAPRRDLSGIWEPVRAIEGIQPLGALNMPADGKPEHDVRLTPYGRELAKTHKSSNGPDEVLPSEENDPAHACDPMGFPRQNLFEVRATEIMQNANQVVLLYTFNRIWRVIWTDGRELQKDPDPHWYGYSVGKWTDDFTFVAQTNGTDARTWVDNAGRPHSEDLRVEEVFHRIDHDRLELSMTIDDPKVYEKPWVALNKLQFRWKPEKTELPEMMCSPSELAEYNRRHASRGAIKK
jgi:hypothetical protein